MPVMPTSRRPENVTAQSVAKCHSSVCDGERGTSERAKKAPKLSPGGRTTFPYLPTPADEEEDAKRKRQTAN